MEFFFVATENGAIYAEFDEQKAPPPCPGCRRRRTSTDVAASYQVEVADASALADLNHAAPVYVASSAFVGWHHGAGLSGLEFEPLEKPAGYARARIVGSARLHPSSRARATEQCPTCGYRYYEVAGPWAIDERAWDGSPFFEIEERRGAMFCSEPAKSALESSGLSGPVLLDMDVVAL